MTCIIGYVEDGTVYMGGDSAAPSGWDMNISLHRKVFIRQLPGGEKILIGFTTSFRMGQLLEYAPMENLGPWGDSDIFGWLVTDFIPWLRLTLNQGGYAKIESNREEGGQFLIGMRGRLFAVWGDYQVAEYVDCFASVGCGAPYALGALWNIDSSIRTVETVIMLALMTAEHFSNGVCAPFYVLELP